MGSDVHRQRDVLRSVPPTGKWPDNIDTGRALWPCYAQLQNEELSGQSSVSTIVRKKKRTKNRIVFHLPDKTVENSNWFSNLG